MTSLGKAPTDDCSVDVVDQMELQMIRTAIFGFALVLAVGPAAAQTTPSAGQPTQTAPVMTDAQFLDKAMASNLFEVETGRLAQTKATDPKLKEFARMMVADHGKALAELHRISRGLNRQVPDKLDGPHQAKFNSLKAKDGAGFDGAYKGEMKAAHADTLSMLQSHRNTAKVDEVKAWIDQALPVVQRHKSLIDGM